MRYIFLIIFIVQNTINGFSQYLQVYQGKWFGQINRKSGALIIELDITLNPIRASISLPQTGIKNLATDSIIYTDSIMSFRCLYDNSRFFLKIENNTTMQGRIQQAGMSAQIHFQKNEIEFGEREQTPMPPFPYIVSEYSFIANGQKINGTLTCPSNQKKVPLVILLTVAGINGRDQQHGNGHKPYAVLSDYLARRGIACFRYDDRGFPNNQELYYKSTMNDFSNDALAIADFFKSNKLIDSNKIGLLGNSEGANVAIMAAAKDRGISFAIMLAGAGLPAREIIKSQYLKDTSINKISNEICLSSRIKLLDSVHNCLLESKIDTVKILQFLDKLRFSAYLLPAKSIDQFTIFSTPWYRYQLKYNPKFDLMKISCPVLALAGSLDQIIDPKINLQLIKKNLSKGKCKDYTVLEIPNVNHVFQTAITGKANEYDILKETFSIYAMKMICDWILVRN